jgi:hypothetical protein
MSWIAHLLPMPIGLRSRRMLALMAIALAGCSSAPLPPAAPARTAVTPNMHLPMLALPPAALGCSVALQQRLTARSPQQSEQVLEALLEVDAQTVRVALFHMGQRMGTITWDGRQLDQQLSRWWPAQLVPAQILSDLQLALWPLDAVQKALPLPWSVEIFDSGRRLSHKHEEHVLVKKMGQDVFAIHYLQAGWSLTVESPGGLQLCPIAEGKQ